MAENRSIYEIIAKSKGFKKTKKSVSGLSSSITKFGAALITTAAIYKGFTKAVESVKLAGKVEGVSRAFNNMTKNAGFTAGSLQKLQEATNGTVNSLDLMTQANNAMLLGIVDSNDSMAEMFDIAQRLAKTMGKDTLYGIESLTTGLGRQSKLMLDNLGIIVDVDKANKDYAKSLNKTTSELTDAERKQAFINKALSEGKELLESVGDEVLDTADELAQLTTSWTEFSVAFGQALIDTGIIEGTTDLLNKLATAGKNLSTLKQPDFWSMTEEQLVKANRALLDENEILDENAVDWLIYRKSIEDTDSGILKLTDSMMELDDGVEFTRKDFDDLIETMGEIQKETSMVKWIEDFNKHIEEEGLSFPTLDPDEFTDTEKTIMEWGTALIPQFGLALTTVFKNKELAAEYGEAMSIFFRTRGKQAWGATWLTTLLPQTKEEWLEAIGGKEDKFQSAIAQVLGVADPSLILDPDLLGALFEGMAAGEEEMGIAYAALLDDLIEKNKEENEVLKEQARIRQENADRIKAEEAARKKLEASIKSNILLGIKAGEQEETISAAMVSAGQKAIKVKVQTIIADNMENLIKFFSPLGPFAAPAALASSAALSNTLSQLINNAGQGLFGGVEFQEGGLIGGRRHSQGGTIIEAEQGEYIMNRNAVESIGVDSLDRMNQGGGSQIIINNPIISSQYVEEELPELIAEAVRKGADFGMS